MPVILIATTSETIAVDKLRRLAEQGDAQAQFHLSIAYSNGLGGVTIDETEAAKLCKSSAEKGYAKAQFEYAKQLASGRGLVKNPEAAKNWFRKAAEQGDVTHQTFFGVILFTGIIGHDAAEAAKWLTSASQQNSAEAQYYLGVMHDAGIGFPKDASVAIRWFRKAAEQNYLNAQMALGFSYLRGEGVPKDTIEALAWFNIAATKGDAKAIQARESTEKEAGVEGTLTAQQRSKEIFAAVNAKSGPSGQK